MIPSLGYLSRVHTSVETTRLPGRTPLAISAVLMLRVSRSSVKYRICSLALYISFQAPSTLVMNWRPLA